MLKWNGTAHAIHKLSCDCSIDMLMRHCLLSSMALLHMFTSMLLVVLPLYLYDVQSVQGSRTCSSACRKPATHPHLQHSIHTDTWRHLYQEKQLIPFQYLQISATSIISFSARLLIATVWTVSTELLMMKQHIYGMCYGIRDSSCHDFVDTVLTDTLSASITDY